MHYLNNYKVDYLDTSGGFDEKNLLASSMLVFTRISADGAEYFPYLNDTLRTPSNRKFDSWWNGILIEDNKRNLFSRKKLVLSMTNQDGASHVDPELNEDYHNLTRMNGMNNFYNVRNQKDIPMLDVELNTMRQIGHEIIISLERYFEKEGITYK
jgi:hypothetical protein